MKNVLLLSLLVATTVACGPAKLESNLEKYDSLVQVALKQVQPGTMMQRNNANADFALAMNTLNVESIYIDKSIKYVTFIGASNIFFGQRGYLYSLQLNENELSEMHQPESSVFLEKISGKWYRSERYFD